MWDLQENPHGLMSRTALRFVPGAYMNDGGNKMLKIKKQVNGTDMLLKLKGKLDTQTYTQLQAEICDVSDEITDITVDMQELEYISSSGLRVLLSASKLMQERDGSISVINANDSIKEVFKITGFNKILNVL